MADVKNSMELALRIRADAESALASMKQVQQQVEKLADSANRASTGTAALGDNTGRTVTAQASAANAAKQLTGQLNQAASAAANGSAGAAKLGRDVGNLASKLATGNFNGAATQISQMGVNATVAAAGMGAIGGAVALVTTALGLLAIAYAKGSAETAAFNNALVLTGGYAGQSVAELEQLASQLDNLQGVTEHAAAAVVAQVTATGRFYGAQVQLVSRAALQMQQATGQSIDSTIQQFEALARDPVNGILKLDSTLHLLTQSTYDQITALVDQGRSEQAAAVAQDALASAIDTRTARVRENVGLLQSAWNGLKNAAKEAWDSMLNVGRSDAGTQLAMWQAQLNAARQNLATPGLSDSAIRVFMGQANEAQQQIDQLTGKTAADAKTTSDAIAAQQKLAQAGITPMKAYVKAVADYTATYNKAIVGASDADKKTALANLQVALQKARDDLDRATRGPKAPKPSTAGADAAQARIQAQAAAAQNSLNQALVQQQAALSPAARIWATYNAAVEKANDDATTAKLAQGANAQSIDAVRDAVVSGAAAARDAALDQLIERDRQAWEDLKRSFATPAELAVEDAITKITQLNDLMAKGVINSDQYQGALAKIGQSSVTPAPHYQGLDAAVGGIGSELRKNYQAEADLNSWYHDTLAQQNAQFDDSDAAQREAHQAAMIQAYQTYANQMTAIDKDRGQLQLQTAADVFGQLATLSSSGNRKIAAVGKAAAIAEAIIQGILAVQRALASAPPPLNFALAAAVGVATAANIAQMRSQQVGGYATGGAIRGPGTATSDSVPILASDGEFMQRAAAVRYYGVDFMHAVNEMRLPRFAQGGAIGMPSPAASGATMPGPSRIDFAKLAAADESARAAPPQVIVKPAVVVDADQLAQTILTTPTGEKLVVAHVADNPRAIRGKWGN